MAEPLLDDGSPPLNDERTLPIVIYVLYLLGWFGFLPILVGLIMAYVLKDGAGERACSHYIFQIRTVWIGLAWAMIALLIAALGVPLTLVLVGFQLLALAAALGGLIVAWALIRSVTGLVYIWRGEMHPRPRTWFF